MTDFPLHCIILNYLSKLSLGKNPCTWQLELWFQFNLKVRNWGIGFYLIMNSNFDISCKDDSEIPANDYQESGRRTGLQWSYSSGGVTICGWSPWGDCCPRNRVASIWKTRKARQVLHGIFILAWPYSDFHSIIIINNRIIFIFIIFIFYFIDLFMFN